MFSTGEPEEAVRLAASERPDALVLDVMMPGMDGFEVCRRVRTADDGNYPVVVMLSARDNSESMGTGLAAGADDYLLKPPDLDELVETGLGAAPPAQRPPRRLNDRSIFRRAATRRYPRGMRPLIAVTGVPIVAGGVLGWRQGAVATHGGVSRGGDPGRRRPGHRAAGAAGARPRPARGWAGSTASLLVGGGDIDPALYGQEPRPEVGPRQPGPGRVRDPAGPGGHRPRRCRRCASAGGPRSSTSPSAGTLHQHIGDLREASVAHRNDDGSDGVLHEVRAQPGSRVMKAMGVERARTFSHHHQAIDRIGAGLVAVGWAEDGLLEAVEMEDGWVLGLQWHAEATAATDPTQQAIFDALVREATAP